jgi:hypothetical protein
MIPERYRRQCEFCGDWLDTRAADVHRFTAGWVEIGGDGEMLEPENRWAHGRCVDAAALPVNAGHGHKCRHTKEGK